MHWLFISLLIAWGHAEAFSLKVLIDLTLENSPVLQQERLKRQSYDANVDNEREAFQPQWQFIAATQQSPYYLLEVPQVALRSDWHNRWGGNAIFSFENSRDFDGKITWQPKVTYYQPLLKNAGSAFNTLSEQYALQESKRMHILYEQHTSATLVQLFNLILHWRLLDSQIAYNQRLTVIKEKQLLLQKKKLELGEISEADYLMMSLSQEQMQINTQELDEQQRMTLNKISRLVGKALQRQQLPTESLQLPCPDWDLKQWLRYAKKHAFSLRLTALEQKDLELQTIQTNNSKRWQLDVFFQSSQWQIPEQLGATLVVPLSDHEQRRQEQALSLAHEDFKTHRIIHEQDLKEGLHSRLDNMTRMARNLTLIQQNHQHTEKLYHMFQKKFQANISSALELEKAFLDWYNSGIRALEKETALIAAKLELLHVTGQLLPTLGIQVAHPPHR